MQAQAVRQSRPVPQIPLKNRYQTLLHTFNISDVAFSVAEQLDPSKIASYQHIQRLKIPGSVHLSDIDTLKKCHLPVPPVDIKQAWGGNELERFGARFLITVNDFDEKGRFYDKNDVTIQLQGFTQQKAEVQQKKLSLKQQKLGRLSKGTVGLSPMDLKAKRTINKEITSPESYQVQNQNTEPKLSSQQPVQPYVYDTFSQNKQKIDHTDSNSVSSHNRYVVDNERINVPKPQKPPKGFKKQAFSYKDDKNYEQTTQSAPGSGIQSSNFQAGSFDNSVNEDDFVEQTYEDYIERELGKCRK